MKRVIEDAKDKRDVKRLISILWNAPNDNLRKKAVHALGEIGGAEAIVSLTKALRDNCVGVRINAVKALSKIDDPRAVKPLLKALGDGNELVPMHEIEMSNAYRAYMRTQHPQIQVNIVTEAGFKMSMWQELCATIMNTGETDAKNIELSLSGTVKVGPVKPVSILRKGEKKEITIGILPTAYGNLPLNVSLTYIADKYDVPIEINDVTYISVAKEDEAVSTQPQTVFNIGSIGEVLGAGAIKTGDVGMIKGGIGSTSKPFSKCPYCGETLNLPKTPKYCPYKGVPPHITVNLVTGYNLLSLLVSDTSVTNASSRATKIGVNGTEIVTWDSVEQRSVSYIPGWQVNDFDIRAGEGYFVNVNNPTTVVFTGVPWCH